MQQQQQQLRALTKDGESSGNEDSARQVAQLQHMSLFYQALDRYTSMSIATVNQTFSLTELFTLATFHLTTKTVKFSLRAAEETVRVFDGLFGSTETSRALAALVTMVRKELINLNDGNGILPGRGVFGTTFATIATLGGLTKALTAYACLQYMTHARSIAYRKQKHTLIYDGFVEIEGPGVLPRTNTLPRGSVGDDEEEQTRWRKSVIDMELSESFEDEVDEQVTIQWSAAQEGGEAREEEVEGVKVESLDDDGGAVEEEEDLLTPTLPRTLSAASIASSVGYLTMPVRSRSPTLAIVPETPTGSFQVGYQSREKHTQRQSVLMVSPDAAQQIAATTTTTTTTLTTTTVSVGGPDARVFIDEASELRKGIETLDDARSFIEEAQTMQDGDAVSLRSMKSSRSERTTYTGRRSVRSGGSSTQLYAMVQQQRRQSVMVEELRRGTGGSIVDGDGGDSSTTTSMVSDDEDDKEDGVEEADEGADEPAVESASASFTEIPRRRPANVRTRLAADMALLHRMSMDASDAFAEAAREAVLAAVSAKGAGAMIMGAAAARGPVLPTPGTSPSGSLVLSPHSPVSPISALAAEAGHEKTHSAASSVRGGGSGLRSFMKNMVWERSHDDGHHLHEEPTSPKMGRAASAKSVESSSSESSKKKSFSLLGGKIKDVFGRRPSGDVPGLTLVSPTERGTPDTEIPPPLPPKGEGDDFGTTPPPVSPSVLLGGEGTPRASQMTRTQNNDNRLSVVIPYTVEGEDDDENTDDRMMEAMGRGAGLAQARRTSGGRAVVTTTRTTKTTTTTTVQQQQQQQQQGRSSPSGTRRKASGDGAVGTIGPLDGEVVRRRSGSRSRRASAAGLVPLTPIKKVTTVASPPEELGVKGKAPALQAAPVPKALPAPQERKHYPSPSIMTNIDRYVRFASAAYGRTFMQALGIGRVRDIVIHDGDGFRTVGVGVHPNHYCLAMHTGIPLECIVSSSYTSGVVDVGYPVASREEKNGEGAPVQSEPSKGPAQSTSESSAKPRAERSGGGFSQAKLKPLIHYVVVDHSTETVVLTLRGTLGLSDLLHDALFEYADFPEVPRRPGEAPGKHRAHSGMLRVARRIADSRSLVYAGVKKALADNPGYGLVLCGHSLGGGVAGMVSILWSKYASSPDSPTTHVTSERSGLPINRPIHCYAYGTPSSVSADLANGYCPGLVTSVINGDDLFPSLSLGIVRDFKMMSTVLLDPDNKGLSERVIAKALGLSRGFGYNQSGGSGSSAAGGDEEDYFWSVFQDLRGAMKAEKLYPIGTVYWLHTSATVAIVERSEVVSPPPAAAASSWMYGSSPPSTSALVLRNQDIVGAGEAGGSGMTMTTTAHVRLLRCDDVRDFGELRFTQRMITDHTPRSYEDAIAAALKGVEGPPNNAMVLAQRRL
ncbi:hypothetical protein BJ742DRAFT_837731, partial [Cladochytrium replicatum]